MTLFEAINSFLVTHEDAETLDASRLRTLRQIVQMHRESERWHWPAEGDMPPEETPVLAHWHVGTPSIVWRSGNEWTCLDTGDTRTRPILWRHLPETP